MTAINIHTGKGKVLPLVLAPDRRLSTAVPPVEKVTDEIRDLLNNMMVTMYERTGVGLAAVQVGIMKRMIVIDTDWEYKEGAREKGEVILRDQKPRYIINPTIIEASEDKDVIEEYCLSVPDIGVEVTRPLRIKVRYWNYEGNEEILEAEGILARCFQHEIDHLNGVILPDYLSRFKKQLAIKKLEKIKRSLTRAYPEIYV
jgi:peptide deformylase